MSEMAFNPPIPVLQNVKVKGRPASRHFADGAFYDECKASIKTAKGKGTCWISV